MRRYRVVHPITVYWNDLVVAKLMNVEFTMAKSPLAVETGWVLSILNPSGEHEPRIILQFFNGFSHLGQPRATTFDISELVADGSLELLEEG